MARWLVLTPCKTLVAPAIQLLDPVMEVSVLSWGFSMKPSSYGVPSWIGKLLKSFVSNGSNGGSYHETLRSQEFLEIFSSNLATKLGPHLVFGCLVYPRMTHPYHNLFLGAALCPPSLMASITACLTCQGSPRWFPNWLNVKVCSEEGFLAGFIWPCI
jgi:hypothetical protein